MPHLYRSVFSISIVFLLFFCRTAAFTHSPEGDDVLRPTAGWVKWGPTIGGSWDRSMGSFLCRCGTEYSGGSGIGGQIGLYLEYHVSPALSLGLDASFGFGSLTFLNTGISPEYDQSGEYVMLEQEKKAVVMFTAISGLALARWSPGVPRLTVHGGVGVDYLLAPAFTDRQRIITPGYAYFSTNTNEKTLVDGKLADDYTVNQMQVSLAVGAGYDIPVSSVFGLRPELTYLYPLTSLVTEYPDWKLSRLQLSVKVLL